MRPARVVSVEPAVLAANTSAPGEPAIVLARPGEGSLKAWRVAVRGECAVEQHNGRAAFVVLSPGAEAFAFDAEGYSMLLPPWALPDH